MVMTSVCLYFKVHQPYRLNIAAGERNGYRDRVAERRAIDIAAESCYIPANAILQRLIEENQGKFRISFSISGIMIELLREYRPDILESFRDLVETGCVEILGETYYHSLVSLHSIEEWKEQVNLHRELVKEVFGISVSVYRNTELIHNNSFDPMVRDMGFKGILCEGVERILSGRDANHIYRSPGGLPLLLRNARLSDDIAFRFDDHSWSEHPLTADKFAEWLHNHPQDTEVINLFMDYETFGLHKHPDTGIFNFLAALPTEVLKAGNPGFALPSEVLQGYQPVGIYNVDKTISWEDRGEAACVWSENMMQHNMLRKVYSLETAVKASNCLQTITCWRQLQSADHFYYMTGENEKYRSPYSSGSEAFEQYSHIIAGFEIDLINKNLEQVRRSSRRKAGAFHFFY
jgi:alpha-amylase